MRRRNEITGDDSFTQYIRTVFIPEMKRIHQNCSSYSLGGRKFCEHKQKLEYFAGFIETQGTEILTLIKDIFIYLSDWERQYTPDIDKNSPSTLEVGRKKNVFQQSLGRILNQAIEVHYMFTREDKDGWHSDPKQFNQDSLDCLTSFMQKFSSLLIELIEYDVQKRTISVTLRNLLRNMKLLEHLQLLQTMEWFTLLKHIINLDLQPTPVLAKSSTQSKMKGRKSELIGEMDDLNEYFNEFFTRVINIEKLAKKDDELRNFLKNKELREVAEVIKELLTELRTGDEVQVDEALSIIEENTTRNYLATEEISDFFILMLTELPDFEYVRLMKVFRRKGSSATELLTNIEEVIQEQVPESLKTIEEGISELKKGQEVISEQTTQIQEFLEEKFTVVIDNQDQIEDFLRRKLGSDFEKIRYLWDQYKEKKIRGREFFKEATKILGNRFTQVFLDIMFFIK